ncbi:MAG: UrcA family protein [Proteobacteria bacterium]|nr:UrcA family protein [Pseudomonadota bacterium]
MSTSSKPVRHLMLCAAGALGLALVASPASAQPRDSGRYYQSGDDSVEVTAPRYHPGRSDIGAPIRNVAMQEEVRFDDLDLRTNHGAHVLQSRVRQTARNLCRRLDAVYPVTADGSPDCYTVAVNNAMSQANAAIDGARKYSN